MNRSRESAKNKSFKPFRDRVFYLDLRNCPQLEPRLQQFIKLYGGKIEGFLSQRVKYVITDKPEKEWPKGKEKDATVESNDEDSCSSKTLPQTHANTHSFSLNRPELFSRGKLLVSKTAQNSTMTTTDPLEIACKRGIKIMSAILVLKYCEEYARGKLKAENDKPDDTNELKIKNLRGHYIKLEDNDRKFRPSCKEFLKWPDINIESPSGCSPFSTKKKKTIEETPVATVTRSLEQISIIREKLNVNKAESITNISTVKGVKKPRASLFCEICGEDFNDTFENHVDSLKHRRFVMNNENYDDLMAVIQSLPKYNFEVVDNGAISDDETIEDPKPVVVTPRSSPTTTTFTLTCGATNSGSFVRLHDYIQQTRNSNSSPPATQPGSGEFREKENNVGKKEKRDDDDFEIVEASAVTPVKDPLRILRNRIVLVSEEF